MQTCCALQNVVCAVVEAAWHAGAPAAASGMEGGHGGNSVLQDPATSAPCKASVLQYHAG